MSSQPLVSILIPAYNAELWIAETIKSALAQTWSRKEIIIVDDGSRDRTVAVARQFAGKDLRVVTQANQGAAAARNTAFSLAQGDYIQWLDADDLLGPEKVARQMALAERLANPRLLYSGGWAQFYWRPAKAQFKSSSLWADLTPAEWLRRKMHTGEYMQTATWLVSRELTVAAGPWNTSLISDDDGEYFCRVLLASEGTRFVPESRVYYRLSGAGQVHYLGRSARKLEPLQTSMKFHVKYMRMLDDGPAGRAACVRHLQRWSLFFYPNRMDLLAWAQQMAAELGGQLAPPKLSWKYAWLQKLIGLTATVRIQSEYNLQKIALLKTWDRAMYRLGQEQKL